VAKDAPVVVPVEVLAGHQVGDPVEGLVVEQQPAEERLLRLHECGGTFSASSWGSEGSVRRAWGWAMGVRPF